jgi:hypothetical protein
MSCATVASRISVFATLRTREHYPTFTVQMWEDFAMTGLHELPDGMRSQLDSPSFQGLATFGSQQFVTEPSQLDAIKPHIAVVGAPWDDSTTNRPGARFGPRALRANAYMPGTYHLDLGVEIFDHLKVSDAASYDELMAEFKEARAQHKEAA